MSKNIDQIINSSFSWANKRLELSGDELNSKQMELIKFAIIQQLNNDDNG